MSAPEPPRPDPPEDPLVGTVLAGRYRILQHLGEGAMGSVYLGEHMRFGRHDAIKILREEMARDREAMERFMRGARNVSAINHPNVCTVYDFGDTDDGRQFLAMEFVEGETLADTLEREGRLPLERALDIVEQIARALDAAHDTGIVHRDLKPGNVMIARGRDGGDFVKVVDFDIAKGTADGAGAEVTRTGFVVGTPEYMSPEQLIGDPLDQRSDVYSLAVVFVRILTGALPVRATTTQDLMVERLTKEPLPLTEIAPELELPPELQAALNRGLERRREDRPDSAGALAMALRQAAAGESAAANTAPDASPTRPTEATVPPTEVGPAPRTGEVRAAQGSPPAQSHRMPWFIMGGVAVVAVIGGVMMFGGDDGTATGAASSPAGAVSDPVDPPVRDDTRDPMAVADDDDAPGASTADTEEQPGGPGGTASDDAQPSIDLEPTSPGAPANQPPSGALSTVEADALLDRQLDLLDGDEPAAWLAAGDSARMVFELSPRLPDDVRGRAAFVAALSHSLRGLLDDALPWARRAVRLAPNEPNYQGLLKAVGGTP